MNREVKFRGKYRNVWVVGDLVQYGIYKSIRAFGANPLEKPTEYMVVPESVGEFTGLKDKNGKEIFEGDLVAEIDNIEELQKWGKPLTVVFGEFITDKDTWDLSNATTGFMLKYNDCEGTTGIHKIDNAYGFSCKTLLVIGNIFETPELLT